MSNPEGYTPQQLQSMELESPDRECCGRGHVAKLKCDTCGRESEGVPMYWDHKHQEWFGVKPFACACGGEDYTRGPVECGKCGNEVS